MWSGYEDRQSPAFIMGSVCSSSQPVRAWPASWNATTLRSAGVITLLFFSIPVFERESGGQKEMVRSCVSVEMVHLRKCTHEERRVNIIGNGMGSRVTYLQ